MYASNSNTPDLVVRNGATYRLLTDHVGSVVRAINVSNASDVPFAAEYTAFGEQSVAVGSADFVPFGFAGGLWDADTGLVRFGARDYDPVVGRWTSKDPIRFGGGQANIYVYVGNDPVNQVDPTGLDDQEFGNLLQCTGAMLACRLTCANPLNAGRCAACIFGALAKPCNKPFGFPDFPSVPPYPEHCGPGFRRGGWAEPFCVPDPAPGTNSCEPDPGPKLDCTNQSALGCASPY